MRRKHWLIVAGVVLFVYANAVVFELLSARHPPRVRDSSAQPVTSVPNRPKPVGYVDIFGKAVSPSGKALTDCLVQIRNEGSLYGDFFSVEDDGSYRGFGPPGSVEVAIFISWPDGPQVDIVHREMIDVPKEGKVELNIQSEKEFEEYISR